jgi:hypothetical protein
MQIYNANNNNNEPCPMSPNIIPNKNGNDIILNNVGLTSL